MKKTAVLLTLLILTVSAGSADVDQVNFRELPSSWETREDLDFEMSSTGSALDRVILQSRSPGEPGFTDRRSKICTDYDNCDWNLEHTESSTRSYEYRFRVQSQGTGESSRSQTVTYYNNLNYYVEWVNQPPNSASRGSNVDMSVSAYDSAGRLDEEGILHLQYRKDNGNWETFDQRDCSVSSSDNRCSNSGEISLNSETLQNGVAGFRGKIVFDGGVSAVSGIQRTSLPGSNGEIDSVNLGNLPAEAVDGSSFSIQAEADGENLQNLYIQEKDPNEPGWTDWRSIDCEGDGDCSFSRNYNVNTVGEKDFRAYVEAVGESDHSSTKTVEFLSQRTRRIDSVVLDNLPDSAEVNTNIDVTGEADGRNLDKIVLKTRSGYSGWERRTEIDCNESSDCEFDTEFSTSRTGTLDFKLVAHAGDKTSDSNIEVTRFIQQDTAQIDSVIIDNLPNDYSTYTDLEITGNAEGEDLDRIILQKRDPNEDWERVTSDSCGNSDDCNFNYDYRETNEQEVDFRLKAEAGDDSEISSMETVDFEDENDNIDYVNINSLPDEYETDKDLSIEGDAQGESLDEITIQEKDEGENDWDNYRNKDCQNDDSCEISRDYSTGSERTKVFRIEVNANGNSERSGTETVEFIEQDTDDIDSVNIDNLPGNHPVGDSLSIGGDAEGDSLDRIIIQERDDGDSNWDNYRSRDCDNDNRCSISRSYTANDDEEKEFRIKVEANGYQDYSSVERVDFTTERSIYSISIQDLPENHRINTDLNVRGELTGQNLEQLTLQTRRGFAGDWNNVNTKNCGGSNSCSMNTDYSTSQTGNVDFRLRGTAGSETKISGIRVVNFNTPPEPEVSSVDIGNLPSEVNVNSDISVTGSATGTMLENISLEYRESGQNSWSSFEEKTCSGSRCDINADYSSSNAQNVDFRVKAWAGSERGYSSTRTVQFMEQVVDISADFTYSPDNPVKGDTVNFQSTSTAENTEITEYRWNFSEDTGTTTKYGEEVSHSWDSTGTYPVSLIITGSNQEKDSIEKNIEILDKPAPPASINSIQINDLPTSYPVNTELAITGTSTGSELDEIILQRRKGFAGDWEQIESTSCSGSTSCNFETDYSSPETTTYDFRLQASADGKTKTSGIESVSFRNQNADDFINSVSLETPSSAQVGEDIYLNASTTGTELEKLVIEREYNEGWSQVGSGTCSSSPCELTETFTRNSQGTENFRARAVANGLSKSSGMRDVFFSNTPEITFVNINNLPSNHPVNQELDVEGSAEGIDLKKLDLQSKASSDGSWNTIKSTECGLSSSCSIQDSVKEFSEASRDYRVVAFTPEENSTSGTETVNFYEPVTTGDPTVSTVTLEELPETHPVDDDLEISAEASGNSIDSIRIQKRKGFTGWELVEAKNCRQTSTCRIEEDFEASETGNIDFRARAEAGDQAKFSRNIETVRFVGDTILRGESQLEVLVRDEDRNDIQDVRVRVRNGDTHTKYTDRDGEAIFNLEPDNYEIRVSRSGYYSEERSVDIESEERRTERFTLEESDEDRDDIDYRDDMRISTLEYDRTICRGEDLVVNVIISNSLNTDERVAVSGTGIGSSDTKVIEVDEDDVGETELRFDNVQNTGERTFSVSIDSDEINDRRTGSVTVENCERPESETQVPTGLSAYAEPGTIVVGETARIRGDLENVKSPKDVRFRSSGLDKTVSSTRSGSYQGFYTPQAPGTKEIRISSEGLSTTRNLEVLPRASIERIEAPRKVFEGEEFEVCATVDSQVDARVLLVENEDTLQAVNDNGDVCFTVEAGEAGEKSYKVRALTSGTGSSAVKTVDVLEAEKEFSSFPGQIASVETESGQAKVDIYNRRESVTDYTVSVTGVDDRWVSQTKKNVVLPRGDLDTVYFYFTPRSSGTFQPTITVEAEGEKLFEREITLESLNREDRGKKAIISRIGGFLTF